MDMDLNKLHISVQDAAGAIPLLIKRNADEPNCWATPDGRVYRDKEWAEKAIELDSQEYKDRQRKRIAAGRLARANVVENYDGWVTTNGDEDDYAASVEELLEKHGDQLAWAGVPDEDIPAQLPAWAFCCTEQLFDFDLESHLDCYLSDEHHEGARDFLVDEKGLFEFFDAWAKKQTLMSYFIDSKRIVVIDRERYEVELAAAKAIIAEDA